MEVRNCKGCGRLYNYIGGSYKNLCPNCIGDMEEKFQEVKKYIEDNITDQKFLDYGFNKDFILSIINDHLSHRNNRENQLWSLLMLRLWFKQWFE